MEEQKLLNRSVKEAIREEMKEHKTTWEACCGSWLSSGNKCELRWPSRNIPGGNKSSSAHDEEG